MYGRMSPSQSSRSLQTRDTAYNPSITTEPTIERASEVSTAGLGVDRNTSIRSIITLPAYTATLNPSERLIAREGERAGVDTVIEFPETAEEEEFRREEDMESLYQIRQARRRENEEREERRQQRQAARETGDWARLEQLRLESQLRSRARTESAASATSSTASLAPVATGGSGSMLMEHNARTARRDRRVSSVSYAELGLARHDGSRLRADSVESNDQRPLLDSAASMGGSRDGSRRNSSLGPSHLPGHHHRVPSAESFMTADSEAQDTPQTSTHGDRSGSDPPSLLVHTGSANNSNERPLPPQYDQAGFDDEEAPPYVSPVIGRRDVQSGDRGGVPAIQVTSTTPANSVPATPVDRFDGADRRGR